MSLSIFAQDVKKELTEMCKLGIRVNWDKALPLINNPKAMKEYEDMSVSECASLIKELSDLL